MTKTIVIPDLLDNLPFHILSWERYQTLCADILYKKYDCLNSREYLSKGSTQEGIDIYSINRGHQETTVAQCKLTDYISPKQVLDAVDLFLTGSFADEAKEFILCTTARLNRQHDEKETIRKAREKLSLKGISFIVWDEDSLSQELRTNPSDEIINIVYRYFNSEITLSFFGDIWSNYLKRLRVVDKYLYPKIEDYISREITSYENRLELSKPKYWYNDPSEQKTLIDIYEEEVTEKPTKIILLSTAGFGKSEELNNIANYFSNINQYYFPIKYSLRNYQGESIETLLNSFNQDWRNIPDNVLLLIFDGLDEITEPNTSIFIKHLNAFIENHQQVNVLISSRYNFYDLKKPPLSNFEVYLLNELTYSDVEKYIDEQLGTLKNFFLELIENKNFSNHLSNPYYLTRFIRFYKKNPLQFPQNKSDLFKKILFEKIESDEKRYNKTEIENRLLPVAQKIAFCMTAMAKSSFSDDEIKVVVPDNNLRAELKHLSILNRDTSEVGFWSFEHKNLQEFLCAKSLLKDTFSDIHEIISFEYDRKKLLPTFLNTISFLFEICDKESYLFLQLFDWISANDPEILIRFEREQLSQGTRQKIFKGLFNYYRDRQITFRVSSNFTLEELAYFIEIDEKIIDFISDELVPALNEGLAYDALRLLSLIKKPYLFKNQLLSVINKILSSGTHSNFVISRCINTLGKLNFMDKSLFEKILSIVDVLDFKIRKELIYVLDRSTYFEDFSDFIIDSVNVFEKGQINTIHDDSTFRLKGLILKLESAKSIKRLLQYAITDKKIISTNHLHSRHVEFEITEAEMIFKKAASFYSTDKRFLRIMYRLYLSVEYVDIYKDWFTLFENFFNSTCGTLSIFLKRYKYRKKHIDVTGFIADKMRCDFLINEFKNGSVDKQQMFYLRNSLSHTNYELFRYLNDQLVTLDAYFIIDDIDVDYAQLDQLQKEKNPEMLLDKNLFFEEADVIFDIIGKEDAITRDDLWHGENVKLRKYSSSLVLDTIRTFCRMDSDKVISREEFFRQYGDDENWDGFVIETIASRLKNKQTLNEQLISIITKWTIKQIESINFENSIKEKDDRWTYIPLVEFVKDIYLELEFPLSDNLILKMFPSDYETFAHGTETKTIIKVGIETIKDRKLLKNVILQTIEEKKLYINVLCSHYYACDILGYSECLGQLFDTIINEPRIEDYTRVTLTEYYLKLGGNVNDFKNYLNIPTSTIANRKYDYWYWFLVKKMIKEELNIDSIARLLIMRLQDEDESDEIKIECAEYLIRLSQIEGFTFWVHYVKRNNAMPFEYREWFSSSFFIGMPDDECISLTIDILDYTYSTRLFEKLSFPQSIEDAINIVLFAVGTKTYSNYLVVKSKIEELVATYPDFTSLRYTSERFSRKYFEDRKEPIDIVKAESLYEILMEQ